MGVGDGCCDEGVLPFSPIVILVRCRSGGGAGGLQVVAGGIEVVFRDVPGLFQ